MSDVEKVQAAFVEVLNLPSDTNWANLAYRRTNGWDSLAHMRIVSILERIFGILLEPEDITDMESYGACLAILREHGSDV